MTKIPLLIAVGLCVWNTHGNLIFNGSFESPGHSNPSYLQISSGGTYITGWWANEAGVDYHNESEFGPAFDGDYMVDLTYGSATGGISQTVPTTPGTRYRVSFAMAGPDKALEDPRSLILKVAGNSLWYTTPASDPLALAWEVKTFEFQALGPSVTLEFVGNDDNQHWGPVIDAVSLQPVPEMFSTLPMLMLAVAGLWAGQRRSHR